MQTMIGTAAHLSTEMLVFADEHVARLTATVKEFEDPEIVMKDPRKEAAEILTFVKGNPNMIYQKRILKSALSDKVITHFGKQSQYATKVLGAAFNEMSKARRAPFLQGVTQVKNTRAIVKRLQPSESFLFGGKLAEVSKNLKDAAQLNPLSNSRGRGNYKRGGYNASIYKDGYKSKDGYSRRGGAGSGSYRPFAYRKKSSSNELSKKN